MILRKIEKNERKTLEDENSVYFQWNICKRLLLIDPINTHPWPNWSVIVFNPDNTKDRTSIGYLTSLKWNTGKIVGIIVFCFNPFYVFTCRVVISSTSPLGIWPMISSRVGMSSANEFFLESFCSLLGGGLTCQLILCYSNS